MFFGGGTVVRPPIIQTYHMTKEIAEGRVLVGCFVRIVYGIREYQLVIWVGECVGKGSFSYFRFFVKEV